MKKRILSSILASCIAFASVVSTASTAFAQTVDSSSVSASVAESVSANNYGLADNIQDGTILHCFDWTYNDIKAELNNIAEAGFTAIQTSPAQQGGGTGVWWWLYQPLGFYIGSNGLGTKAELQSLCTEAEKYGIKVVVDVVANHLAGNHSNIDNDLKSSQYWHTYGSVSNWADRYQVTHGEIGMPDLNTENSYVQNKVKNYISELKSVGVDGIRFDAAKHIGLPSEGDGFWSTVTSDKSMWYYGEILGGPDDRESGNEGLMKEYTSYITVTDSNYSKTLRDSFNSGYAPSSYGNWCARGISNNKLIYWAESHDTWSNNKDWGYSNGMSQNVIDRAYAIAASRDDITALYFSRPSSSNKDSIMIGQKGSTHFTSSEVAAVNHFHNAMIGQKDYYVNSNGNAAVCREEGVVVVKGSGSGYVSIPNGGSTTKPGTYTDEITGSTWTVTSSTISGTVGSSGIAVVYNPKPASPSVSITPGSKNYKTDTLTLSFAYNSTATSAQYSIDGGAYQNISNGGTITIGAGLDYGTKTTVTVKASDGSTTSDAETYTYTKVDPSAVQMAYFDNSSYNWSSVYAYIYSDTTNNGAWPGTKLTLDSSTGYYAIEIPEDFADGYIIFTESSSATTNRYPADMQPGLKLSGTSMLFKANHEWVEYSATPTTKPTSASQTTEPTESTKATTPSQPTERILTGDVNFDGEITVRDAALIQRYISNSVTISDNLDKFLIAADVSGDSRVTVMDAAMIQRYIAHEYSSSGKCGEYYEIESPTTAPTTVQTEPTETTKTTQATTQAGEYTITFTNNKSWGSVNCYYWSDSDTKMTTWPGKTMTYSTTNDYGEKIYTINVPSTATYIIFNDGNGSQTVDISITGSAKYYISGGSGSSFTVSTWQ